MPNNGDKPATKSDLLAVRSELKEDFKRLAIEIGKTNIRMDKVEDRILSELRSFRGELLAAFETSVVKGKRYEEKALSHGAILVDHEDKLKDHGKRLSALEASRK